MSGVAQVVFGPVLDKILGESFLGGLIQSRESCLRGTKVFSEEGNAIGGAEGIVEHEFLFGGFETRDFSRT
jgi:hypothetical protein